MAKTTNVQQVTLPAEISPEEVLLLRRAASNEENSRSAVRGLLARRSGLVQSLSATAAKLEGELIQHAGGHNVLEQESMREELALMRASLQHRDDGPLELLLIEQVVICWLTLMTAERLRAQECREGTSIEWAAFLDRHVSRLRADYLRAIRTLASTRRILVSPIQVNIAEQQVNSVRS